MTALTSRSAIDCGWYNENESILREPNVSITHHCLERGGWVQCRRGVFTTDRLV